MKKVLLLIALATAAMPLAQGGTLAITSTNTNFVDSQRPLARVNGTGLLTGGIVAIGSWAADPAPIFAQLAAAPSSTLWNSIVDSFLSYGSTTSVGSTFEGLYESVASENRDPGNPLDGKTIYTLIGNGATLRDSTEATLVAHGATFSFSAPVADARADIAAATAASVLFGNINGPSVTTALGAGPALQLAPTVPEPFSATLLLTGLALVFRRRR